MMSKKIKHEDHELKGTLISVFAIGIFIIVMWFGVYFFYLSR
ncbi:cytochrome c oxidase subunit 2A [Metabacillus litoralis]|nr:cytochrome c oxidase subunit 2A [Metabacillus litoralis]MCM3161076.1 cytochrome c oxidase subunit 2A [Metabacillus litoralis]MCM3412949.1 cytochrome c oxidase subunit 2A [Metabacillus litoralis]UHA62035.1 cytochrome c oxidase subunit 2A [Metabacillus litoralis]